MCRCGTSAYKSSSSDWKRKAATDAHTLNEYAELFGSGEAGTTEPAEAGVSENGRSHAALDAQPAADAAADDVAMTDDHTGHEGHAAAASTQPAATEKEKKKKKKNKEQKNSVLVESPAPVQKKKKSKKQASDVSMMDLDSADAPWVNEPVAAAQQDDVKQAERAKMGTEGERQQTTGAAHAPLNKGQALALLGFAAAKPLSQHKKQKKRDC